MSARDVIAEELERYTVSPGIRAESVIAALRAAGYVILSSDEVRGIRDEAKAEGLEEAADYCWSKRDLLADAEKKQIAAGLTGRDYYGRRLEAELLSRAIRTLKGGRDAL